MKHFIVVCSGFNTDYKSSEPLKTLVMLCYVMRKKEIIDIRMPNCKGVSKMKVVQSRGG